MLLLPVLVLGLSPAISAADMPAAAARGKAVYSDASRKMHCSTCHALKQDGNAVGPDFTKIARLNPKAFEMSVMTDRTVYAKEIETKTKEKLVAMVVSETDKELTVFNLDVTPPAKQVLDKANIYAVRDNTT